MMANEMDHVVSPMTNGHMASNGKNNGSTILHTVSSMDKIEKDGLEFVSSCHPSNLLAAMGSLQRQNQFCDAVLRVGERELQVHRAVLAAASPFLFELFSRPIANHCPEGQLTGAMYKIKDITFAGFVPLLDYMYSGRLCVAAEDVGEVYRTAKILRMGQAAQACSQFLADRLTPTNCLDLRKHAGDDSEFCAVIDNFIQENISNVLSSKHANGLPELQVEIIGAEEALGQEGSERQLFNLVLEWARNSVDLSKPRVDLLTEEVSMLYLNSDNHLQDCREISDPISDDVVLDYKKHSRRRSTMKNQNQDGGVETSQVMAEKGPMPFKKFNINPEKGQSEKEWSVIAILKQNEHSYAGLAVLAGETMAITVHLRQAVAPAAHASDDNIVPPVTPEARDVYPSLVPLEAMSQCRCAFGVCVVDGTIIVCGGYDRGECLVSVEAYSMTTGRWINLPDMLHPRARFGAAALQGCLYVVGGSDGMRDLGTVHYLSLDSKKWKTAASLGIPRSSVGVAELEGRLYCVGGSEGQSALSVCEMYDPQASKWTTVAPLKTARYQASVSAYAGGLVAIGGTDTWNCLNTVEVYNPASDSWTYIAPLNNPRRGAGVDVLGDKLWVVGGSDGISSLRLTEIYDPVSFTWSLGPQLNVPRANVSAASVNRKLYAIGGFSGKKFLNSMEVLFEGSQEWSGFNQGRRSTSRQCSSTSTDDKTNGHAEKDNSSSNKAKTLDTDGTDGPGFR